LFDKAYAGSTDSVTFVESPLVYNKRTGMLIQDKQTSEQISPGQLQQFNSSFDRLIIYKNKKTGKIDQQIVSYVPDLAYLQKHNFDASKNRINHLDEDFSGYIIYKSWNEKVLSILRVVNGKGVGRISKPRSTTVANDVQQSNKAVQDKRKAAWVCVPQFIYEYTQLCYYSDPEHTQNEQCGPPVLTGMYYAGDNCYEDGGSNPCNDPATFNPACGHNPCPTCDGGGGATSPSSPEPDCPTSYKMVNGKMVRSVNPCNVQRAKIKTDSLKAKFPCAVSLIIDNLSKLESYHQFVEPFTTSQKPDLNWDSKELTWHKKDSADNYQYMLGGEQQDPTSFTGQSRTIYLNSKALQNSSQLLITAGAIHETLHAYIGYSIATSESNVLNRYNDYGTWFAALDAYYTVKDLPANYSGHYQMLTDYFNKATSILAAWDNNQHTKKEYVTAMLFGLNTVDSTCPPDMKARLDKVFNEMKTAYGITEQNLTDFNKANLNAPANSKLPTSGC
jgi:hypothetical protein